MLKIAFYYNHYNSLGHGTRSFNLLSYFKKNADIDLLILQGGKKQELLDFESLGKVVLLPHSYGKSGMVVDNIWDLYNKVINTDWARSAFEDRKSLIISEIRRFKPDIFITEYYPMGDAFWTDEVPDVLETVQRYTDKIYCSCGYVSPVKNVYDIVGKYYKAIFIHSPEDFLAKFLLVFDMPEEYRKLLLSLLNDFNDIVHFTGFITDKALEEVSVKTPFVLITRGSGVVNKGIVSLGLVLAKKRPDLNFVMVMGPSSNEKDVRDIIALAPKNLKVYKSLSPGQFNFLLKSCKVSINMSGYNTIVKLMYFRKPTIIYPLMALEQVARAKIMSDFLPSRVIEDGRPVVKECLRWIDELWDAPCGLPFDKGCFNGEELTFKAVLNDLQ